MEKKTYNEFINGIKTDLFEFLFKYNIPFECKFPQNENEDIHYTINLGNKFGFVNILFESYNNLPTNEKNSDTFTICMKFWKCNENHKRAFNFDSGQINEEDGTFILFSKESSLESLKNDFKYVLDIWANEQTEKSLESMMRLCVN